MKLIKAKIIKKNNKKVKIYCNKNKLIYINISEFKKFNVKIKKNKYIIISKINNIFKLNEYYLIKKFKKIYKYFNLNKKINIKIEKEVKGGYLTKINEINYFLPKSLSKNIKTNCYYKLYIININYNKRSVILSLKKQFKKNIENKFNLNKIKENYIIECKIYKKLQNAYLIKYKKKKIYLNFKNISKNIIKNKIKNKNNILVFFKKNENLNNCFYSREFSKKELKNKKINFNNKSCVNANLIKIGKRCIFFKIKNKKYLAISKKKKNSLINYNNKLKKNENYKLQIKKFICNKNIFIVKTIKTNNIWNLTYKIYIKNKKNIKCIFYKNKGNFSLFKTKINTILISKKKKYKKGNYKKKIKYFDLKNKIILIN
ncbi:MAG: hypothetical protein AAYR31_00450 [Candidatus Vidania fulgoroideorum]